MFRASLAGLLFFNAFATRLFAQAAPDHATFSRLNSFGIFAEYSNDSSHILLGSAEQRKLLGFGLSYSRRVLLRPSLNLQYLAEVRPIFFDSDPVVHVTAAFTLNAGGTEVGHFTERQSAACRAYTVTNTFTGSNPGTSVETAACGRTWTFGEGLSPAGLRLNLRPRRQVQPVFSILGGYAFSTQPIPVDNAGSFNFTLELGAGVEFFRASGVTEGFFGNHSLRAEYRYHHLSNGGSAQLNPGIDNSLFQVTYAFGR